MAEAKNKVAVAGIVSILLVAAVVGVAIGVSKKGGARKAPEPAAGEAVVEAAATSPLAIRQWVPSVDRHNTKRSVKRV